MSYSREHIGNVKVVSGVLVLTDPTNLNGRKVGDIVAQAPAAASMVDAGESGEIQTGLAVAFGTPFADGDHKVFVSRNAKGVIVGVEIELSE